MNSYTVVVDDCAFPAAPDVRPIRFLETSWGPKNFDFRPDNLVRGLPDRLTPIQLDWLYLVTALYATDRACNRAGGDVAFNRSITLHFPVTDPDYWRPLVPLAERLFASLTFDRLRIELHQLEEPRRPPRQATVEMETSDCVALLSGGADSFVGALSLLKDESRKPAFVSHAGSGAVQAAQRRVREVLETIDRGRPFLKFAAEKGPDFPGDEFTQRSRSLMFVGAAATIASCTGLEEVFINENGVMAIHAPLTEARVGSLSTRTAFPPILEDMSQLASAALGTPVRIENRLLLDTKPDVVGRGTHLGYGHVLHVSVSCWKIGRTSKQCGACVPCIVRRISFEHHNVADSAYEKDVLVDEVSAKADLTAWDNLVHLCGLVADLSELSDEEIEFSYPEILNTGSNVTAREVLDMHRRWAEQAAGVLQTHPVTRGLL